MVSFFVEKIFGALLLLIIPLITESFKLWYHNLISTFIYILKYENNDVISDL